jgi:uncharacterized DUF497 family protein
MSLIFEWDAKKAEQNLGKHGVSFGEASTIFADPLARTIPDPLHSEDETRFITTGLSHRRRRLVVAYTERAERIRIISARAATPRERNKYAEGRE